MEWLIAILSALISAVIASLFVMFLEAKKKPELKITICEPQDGKYEDGTVARKLWVEVENKKTKWISRNPAYRCYGYINFYHLDGQDVFGRSMPVKWSNLPGVRMFPDGRKEVYPFEFVKYIDIHAGYTERIDLAARYDDDKECFGWTYENYFSEPRW